MENKIPLIAVVGPTASGKTALGVKLATNFGGEVVSADSMQIYKNISIAAAVPTKAEMCGIKHHLLEFLNTDEKFSVADYVNKAKETIFDINKRNKQAVLVGGTGLYVNSLVDNITFTEEPCDECLRAQLEEEFDHIGGEEMLKKLALFDADSAARLHANNRRRIIRAFEVYKLTGKTVTEQNKLSKLEPSPFNTVLIGITYRDREKLYSRINKRVDIMLENGLLEEAKNNISTSKTGAAQAIGHKEFIPYFNGECPLEEAVECLKRETRRYAKRQLTWFTRDQRINWIYADEQEDIESAAIKIVREEFGLEG